MPSRLHHLPATPETVHWGFFDRSLSPVLTVNSGDIIQIDAVTHHAGDAPDLLMDTAIRLVYEKVTDRGPGVHIMTGPIQVAAGQAEFARRPGLCFRILAFARSRSFDRSFAIAIDARAWDQRSDLT